MPEAYSENGGNLAAEQLLDLNTATVAELENLPAIGEKSARKIVEYREKYGKFRRPEQLIMVDGISDEKFRRIKNLVKID